MRALFHNTMGNLNVALGNGAGFNATTGSNNVFIGANVTGIPGESNACYIGSIFNQVSVSAVPVVINAANKLGTIVSSKRFKEDIKPLDKSSEVLLALRPVTFRYKKEIDPAGRSQSGLVAEDVEKVNPDLVIRDKEGKPYSVRYDQVNSMLLNEFLKEHKAFVEEQHNLEKLQAIVARQQKQIEALTAGLQKVSAQLQTSKPAPQTVLNNQ
jgi:trimeric autotransporter adhesin